MSDLGNHPRVRRHRRPIDALACKAPISFALGSRCLGTSLNPPLSRRMLLKAVADLVSRASQPDCASPTTHKRPARDYAPGASRIHFAKIGNGPRLWILHPNRCHDSLVERL